MVTVHIFFDKGGFFSNKAIEFVEKVSPKKHLYYFQSSSNLNHLNINLIEDEYTLLNLIQDNKIQKVIFHSLHYFQFDLLSKIKKNNIIIAWVFWSFEYYQLPFNLSKLYSIENRNYFFRKLASVFYQNIIYLKNKKVRNPFYLFRSNYTKAIDLVDEFYSFVEDDFHTVFPNKKIKYSYLPYLDSSDIVSDSNKKTVKSKIMIGHSGSPLLNHIEICSLLEKHKIESECLFSLSYGNKQYIKGLKNKLKRNFDLNYKILDKRLPLDQYYETLKSVSIFFLNSYCQQGLGNIVYFLVNGTALYLSDKSTTYTFLKRKGFVIFSIEAISITDEIRTLTPEEADNNNILISELLEPSHVLKQWNNLLS